MPSGPMLRAPGSVGSARRTIDPIRIRGLRAHPCAVARASAGEETGPAHARVDAAQLRESWRVLREFTAQDAKKLR